MWSLILKLEPRFPSFLLAALVSLSYPDFTWFGFPDPHVYPEVGEETGRKAHLPLTLAILSSYFGPVNSFCYSSGLFMKIIPVSLCFIESIL